MGSDWKCSLKGAGENVLQGKSGSKVRKLLSGSSLNPGWLSLVALSFLFLDLEMFIGLDFDLPMSVQQYSYSVAQWCLTLHDPMDCSTPGFPVLHYLPEFPQIHVHWIRDTVVQPSHSLSLPSPSALSLSQQQNLFQRVCSSYQVANVLELQLQHVFLKNIQGWYPLGLTGLNSLLSKRLPRVFSSTTVQKHQFFGTQPSLWSNSHIHTWLLEKP